MAESAVKVTIEVAIMYKKYTKEMLEEAVKQSYSISDVMRFFGLNSVSGGGHRDFRKRIDDYKIDTSHFKRYTENINKCIGWNRHSKESFLESLKENVNLHGNKTLKRLIEFKIKQHKCEICGLDKWMGNPIPLEVDHINGDHYDNRLENIRLLCPNCHTQTETFGSKNINKKPV